MEENKIVVSEQRYAQLICEEAQTYMIVNALRTCLYDGDFRKFCAIILGFKKEGEPDA